MVHFDAKVGLTVFNNNNGLHKAQQYLSSSSSIAVVFSDQLN